MSRISIIMPAYNSENSITKSIQSVLNQSFQDFELIIVDDGSTDETLKLANLFASKDDRIKIISIANNGVSNARNTGIKYVQSKYLVFLDSDDYYEPRALEIIMNNIKEDTDLLIFNRFTEYKDGKFLSNKAIEECTYSSKEDIRNHAIIYINNSLLNVPWNKVYKKDIIDNNNIVFPNDIDIAEDLIFNINYIKDINNMSVINDKLIHYVIEKNKGLSAKFRENRLDIRLGIYHEFVALYKYWGLYSKEIENSLFEIVIKDVMAYFMDFYKIGCVFTKTVKISKIHDTLKIQEVKVALEKIKGEGITATFIKAVLNTNNAALILFTAKLLNSRRKYL
ncbi:glycosyltransferase family 2 protein [Candidatus Clostridium radicumherbarum]|uniref:Glycosyltransferase family 2 protein n=1 Tax=Candidatus Clostridium radicumherbarum TaxID=3381662 RepID=A0ABW8TVZ7_9CLOT